MVLILPIFPSLTIFLTSMIEGRKTDFKASIKRTSSCLAYAKTSLFSSTENNIGFSQITAL